MQQKRENNKSKVRSAESLVNISHSTLYHVIRCPKWPLLEDDLTIHA